MAYEPAHMPTKPEIIEKAMGLFHEANPDLPHITPTEAELKEASFFERARSELMSGVRSDLERYLSELESEADKIRGELGIEKPLPTDERMTDLEDKLVRTERRLKTTRERLKEAEEELRKIHEKPPPPPVPLAPPPPPPIPTGLTDEDKKRLEVLFKRIFMDVGVSYVGKLRALRDDIKIMQETYKDIPRPEAIDFATKEVKELAGRLIPYKPPPPIPVPVAAVPIRVAMAEERVRKIERRMCIMCRKYFTIDIDLMRRVSESTTEIRGRGRVRHTPPILEFPERFYHMCPSCRYAKFGYLNIYDAIAYLLAEARRSSYKKIKLTKDKLRAVGLNKTDLDEIQTLESRYRVSSSS